MADLVIAVEKTVTTTETVGVTLKRLTVISAATHTPGTLEIELAPKTEAGDWDESAQSIIQSREDMMFETDPRLRYAASMFHELMFSAIVTDTPQHQFMGIAGLSVWEAAKVILAQEISNKEQENDPEENTQDA
jgi:hypothetical protein